MLKEVNDFTQSHQTLERKNQGLEKEIKVLNEKNEKIKKDNNRLKDKLKLIITL